MNGREGVERLPRDPTRESMLAHWLEWKRVCALDRCGAEARRALRAFAGARLTGNLRRYAQLTGRRDAAATALHPRDAWHLLETHLTVRDNRAGKRYKDWLFARADAAGAGPLRAIESGAALLMRDVTREYLRREFPPAGTVSLDDSTGCAPTLAELLPSDTADPANDAALREYERLAALHAAELFAQADRRQKTALLAREMDLTLSDPDMLRTAGCAHTALYAAYPAFINSVGAFVSDHYPEDDDESRLRLALMMVNAAKKMALAWNLAEKRQTQTLVVMGNE